MRTLVCGSRYYSDRARLFEVLDSIHRTRPIGTLIHGGATGADRLADDWVTIVRFEAFRSKFPLTIEMMEFRADWKTYGNSAGPRRNQRMLNEGKPDLVVAFPGGVGTVGMCRLAHKAKVEILTVDWSFGQLTDGKIGRFGNGTSDWNKSIG